MTRKPADHDPADLGEPELDELLMKAHENLLRHIQRHTDPTAGLVAFMEENGTVPPSPPASVSPPVGRGPDLAVLELRRLFRRVRSRFPYRFTEVHDVLTGAGLLHPTTGYPVLLLTLAIVCDRVHALRRAVDGDLNLARILARVLDGELARVRAFVRDHGLELDRLREDDRLPDDVRITGIGVALQIAHDHIRRLDLDQTLSSDRARRDFARDRVGRLTGDLDLAIASDLDLGLDLKYGPVPALVEAAAGELAATPVDVSGVDLSHLRDMDLDDFAGAVWTRDTAWPSHLGESVESHSEEIGDGVFQVRGGTERDPHRSALT